MGWLIAKTLRTLLWLKVKWSLSRKLLLRINWRIVEISKQVLYFSTILMMWSFASLSLMVLLSVCLRGAMVFSKKSVNEWVAEYENEKLWCMVWSRDGLSSLGFSYWEFWNARGEKGRLKGEDPGSNSLARRELQEDGKVKTTHTEQVVLRNAF